jgi:hypothetical protein
MYEAPNFSATNVLTMIALDLLVLPLLLAPGRP